MLKSERTHPRIHTVRLPAVSNLTVPVFIVGFTLLAIGGCVRDIWRGTSAPYLLAWCIRTALCTLLFAALLYEGMSYTALSLWGAQLVGCVSIIVATMLKHGKLGRLSQTDSIALCLASVGALAWVMSGDASYSIIGVITAEVVATIIGIRAARLHGRLESTAFWTLALCAASLALITANQASFVMILAPLFSVVNALTNVVVVRWITRQRRAAQVSAA